MHLRDLRLQRFRNHIDSLFEFGGGCNVLAGDNGQGKTNVIEAISYLCLTKSFFASSDSLVLNFSSDLFEVEGSLVSEGGKEYRVRVAYMKTPPEKVFSVNKRRAEPFSNVVGMFPVVICSPEHAPITSRGPSERRRFVDLVISQSDPAYFQNLVEYRKVLKHRNAVLLEAKAGRQDPGDLLEPWDEQLAVCGSHLISKRQRFVEEFQPFIRSAYAHICTDGEEPQCSYVPALEAAGEPRAEDALRQALLAELSSRRPEEVRFGTTLVGPHRDEFQLSLTGLDLRKFASQGQHKTMLVALKIGEFYYLKERCRETPIMLLDDIFSELDGRRARSLLEFVQSLNQTFITSTDPHLFDSSGSSPGMRLFMISGGRVLS
jgi:DNA replication and repair protein RecF